MIGYLRGVCQEIADDHLIVDVHGVGYEVFVSDRDIAAHAVGGDCELRVHTVVREDAFLLYGFSELSSRSLFRHLLTVPNIGPKAALAILSAMTPGQAARAIQDQDIALLTKAKGIGKRGAETIVVKLRDRLPPELLAEHASAGVPFKAKAADMVTREVQSALINLGYKPANADAAIALAIENGAAGFDAVLRATLASLRRPS